MKFFENKVLVVLSAFLMMLITFSAGYILRDQDILPPTTTSNSTGVLATDRAFFETLELLINRHYTQPTREELLEGAIEGMIDATNDPYTTYFDLEEAENYYQGFQETYVGIGVTVSRNNGLILIESINQDGPAFDVGLRVGDVIVEVDGIEIYDLEFYEVLSMILGEEGTLVQVGVWRNGFDETLHFPITRRLIDNSSVEYEMIEADGSKLGYIKVHTFGIETAVKFAVAVQNLENEGMDSLIVDLRDNGGGQLTAVQAMLNIFLRENGVPMFTVEMYNLNALGDPILQEYEYISNNDTRKDYNVVTLINENSASASEVFASSMSEHGGYTLVGETSFGKGTVQIDKTISSTTGDQLHITIGTWYTTNGNWVHFDGGSDGIVPDIVINKEAIEVAYKVFLLDEEPILPDTVDDRTANIQVILNMMGYTVRTDGYFDASTEQAVRSIQIDNALPITGELDADTLLIINTALETYISSMDNDTQLQAAITYLLENPEVPDEPSNTDQEAS